MRYAYPCEPEPNEPEGSFTVTFRDIPDLETSGNSLGEAMEKAQEALEFELAIMLRNEAYIPEPSTPKHHEEMIVLTPAFAAKMALIEEMRLEQITPEELGRRTGIDSREIEQILDPWETSGMEQLTWALSALGLRIVLEDLPEETGEHFHEPAQPGPITRTDFIRRLRRRALHGNIRWVMMEEDQDGRPGVQIHDKVVPLPPQEEISYSELSGIIAELGFHKEEF